ncbi:protein tyrosine kinase transcriptional regulator PtkA [Mycobacterium tuberculosis KT-0108]|nr:protein tyrosine kinase transcriptional regulator PtkA [Mycobacterium tuberculosis KT-0108]
MSSPRERRPASQAPRLSRRPPAHQTSRSSPDTTAPTGSGLSNRFVNDNGIVTDTTASGTNCPPPPRAAARRASSSGESPQLVIFDLDGTLTDSARGIVSSFRHALNHIGAPVPEGDLATHIVGPPMHETLRAMGLGESAEEAIVAYRADYSARGWAMNSLFDGIGPLLADLRTAGVRLAVATSKAEPTARRILRHFGIEQHFEVIAGASTDGSRGSKVDVLAHALAQLRPLPERLVMVGDRSHDVDGAAAHGIDTVVVGWGYGRADFIDKTSTTVVTHAATIDELREALGV